jgi:signal transduction histidine kinase
MILIVDDKQENVFSLRTALEQHGFLTDAALSGEEALKKLLKNEYSLIILDVQMPGMDGFEVAEAVTGLNKTKDIPIIFLSAVSTHKQFVTKGFESGAVEYLTKPVDPDILILKVRNFYRLFEKTQALKAAEKALAGTVTELKGTLESLPQLAFTANREGQIEYVNKAWMEFTAAKETFPQTPEGQQPLSEKWLQSIKSGQLIEAEVMIRKMSDGQFYHHLLRAAPVMVNGYITKWVGSLTSIHEQKMLNELLEQKVAERTTELMEKNRQLAITNDDLQQFTSVTSHDLKEPLRKIQFYGNMLRDKSVLDTPLSGYLDKMIHAARRMTNLINDLLSFSSLAQQNHYRITDLNALVKDILSDLELNIEEKKARIDVASLPPLEVIPGLMRQLLQNIISNALKFTRPEVPPQILIRAQLLSEPELESPVSNDGPYCCISIADNGIGFNEKYGNKIFTIFQRLNAATDYEGTGIGLAIAKKITDRHHGKITARSQPGQGATFYIILPIKQDPALQQPVTAPENSF